MAKAVNPRHGSMGVWPRVRSQREHARIRSWLKTKEAKPAGFAGYKVGMTHVVVADNRPNNKTKGQDLRLPVTIIECPPIKVIGATLYQQDAYGLHAVSHITIPGDKYTKRALPASKKNTTNKLNDIKPEEYADIRLVVQTQPHLTSIGKKKPEIFELGLGGPTTDQLAFVKENMGKELLVQEMLAEGQQLDAHAITKGKGYQGPVKRFGVSLRAKKSEKVKRGPGALGSWKAQAHTHYRIAKAGQTGYHQRLDINKWLIHINDKPENINAKGGFKRYGFVKNPYVLIKGSLPGPAKRLIKLTHSFRPRKNIPKQAPSINYISTSSQLGR